ncbi:hypothetical protein FSP39_014833 [Pinctada imbricata]|uniref:Syntaxin-8 n=1 Tax=Pinctada imbricata TaxID=66713 RepID=A0AA89BX58_PINIB|nr:hypothetical protein FSP39_014833 [Pinctada imbricata]
MEQITERNKHSRTSSNYTKLSANIRASMKRFTTDLNKLRQNLIRASSSYHITQREVERRQMMMDNLTTKEKQIDQAFKNEGTDSRYSLMGTGGVDAFGSSDPWGMREEPEDFQGMSNQDIRQQQQHAIKEQDKGLEALSRVISRQKQMAIDIGDEVDSQNDLIDDIGDHMDRTGERLIKETRHIRMVDRKSATCGRKTKVWCILDGKELVFYRENKRSSCIGSEDLTEIRSIQRVDGSDPCDFKIETETKSTVYSAENGTACEQWVLHIKEALDILGVKVCTEKVKESAKERINIPKSPEKSVHSLMQLWQQGPNNPVNRNRKLEQRKPENNSKNSIIEHELPVNHMKGNRDDIVQSRSQNKDSTNESKAPRTDSGYETIPSEKRNSDHKLETAPNDTKNEVECSEADDLVNGGDTNEVVIDEKFPKENREGNSKIDIASQEPLLKHSGSQQTQPRQIVTHDVNDEGTQEVDLSNVVYRRKSRPSVMESSLSFDENSNNNDANLVKSNGHPEISRQKSENEVFESSDVSKNVENSALQEESQTTSQTENVTTPVQEEDEPPVVLRKVSVANGVDNHQTTNVMLSVRAPTEEEEEDVVDGEVEEDDLNVEDFEEFLNDLTFDPLPELTPLKLDDISESLSGITDLIADGMSRRSFGRSAIKSQTGDELAQLKEMLSST